MHVVILYLRLVESAKCSFPSLGLTAASATQRLSLPNTHLSSESCCSFDLLKEQFHERERDDGAGESRRKKNEIESEKMAWERSSAGHACLPLALTHRFTFIGLSHSLLLVSHVQGAEAALDIRRRHRKAWQKKEQHLYLERRKTTLSVPW